MDIPHTKQELQAAITQEHTRLLAALARIDDAFLSQPGVQGDWRVQTEHVQAMETWADLHPAQQEGV